MQIDNLSGKNKQPPLYIDDSAVLTFYNFAFFVNPRFFNFSETKKTKNGSTIAGSTCDKASHANGCQNLKGSVGIHFGF